MIYTALALAVCVLSYHLGARVAKRRHRVTHEARFRPQPLGPENYDATAQKRLVGKLTRERDAYRRQRDEARAALALAEERRQEMRARCRDHFDAWRADREARRTRVAGSL